MCVCVFLWSVVAFSSSDSSRSTLHLLQVVQVVQVVFERHLFPSGLHDGLIANPPPGAPRFDDQVDLAHKQMRTCTFSRTADGMQTQESFIQYLEQLDREITAHSDAAVAAGGEPIERPVVLCLDNHASRYSEEAQGGVGSVVATGHPPLHRGADDVRLPAVARPVQRQRVCARSGHVLLHAGHSCWATTRQWVLKSARRVHRRPVCTGYFLGVRRPRWHEIQWTVWGILGCLGVLEVVFGCSRPVELS